MNGKHHQAQRARQPEGDIDQQRDDEQAPGPGGARLQPARRSGAGSGAAGGLPDLRSSGSAQDCRVLARLARWLAGPGVPAAGCRAAGCPAAAVPRGSAASPRRSARSPRPLQPTARSWSTCNQLPWWHAQLPRAPARRRCPGGSNGMLMMFTFGSPSSGSASRSGPRQRVRYAVPRRSAAFLLNWGRATIEVRGRELRANGERAAAGRDRRGPRADRGPGPGAARAAGRPAREPADQAVPAQGRVHRGRSAERRVAVLAVGSPGGPLSWPPPSSGQGGRDGRRGMTAGYVAHRPRRMIGRTSPGTAGPGCQGGQRMADKRADGGRR